MVSHFRGVAKAQPYRLVPPPEPAHADLQPAPEPLLPVLERLVGREITLSAGGHKYHGRLLLTEPVTLIGPEGRVTVVTGRLQSVAY